MFEQVHTMLPEGIVEPITGPEPEGENSELHLNQVFISHEHAMEFIDEWAKRNFSPLAKVFHITF